MSFLIADGVVPSNEDRGYVLRRLMRRAIVQGRRIGIEPGFLPRFAAVVRETDGRRLPRAARAGRHRRHVARTEEEAFNQHARAGHAACSRTSSRARRPRGEEGIGADEAFQLHDTYGFPFDLTLELAAEQGLGVDEQGFEELMEEQRARARASAGRGGRDEDARAELRAFAAAAGAPPTFTGYETTEQATAVGARRAGERPRAGQARRVAVLRHRRRPGARRAA